MIVSKSWQDFNFLVNYPFNITQHSLWIVTVNNNLNVKFFCALETNHLQTSGGGGGWLSILWVDYLVTWLLVRMYKFTYGWLVLFKVRHDRILQHKTLKCVKRTHTSRQSLLSIKRIKIGWVSIFSYWIKYRSTWGEYKLPFIYDQTLSDRWQKRRKKACHFKRFTQKWKLCN